MKLCMRTSWYTPLENPDPSSKEAGATATKHGEKLKNRFDPVTEMNHIGATLEALRPTNITDEKDLLPALERRKDEIRKHEEITGAASLNEATKKAIATDMAPPDLAAHWKLNAHRHNTYAELK